MFFTDANQGAIHMHGETVITFDEPFQYSKNGNFEPATTITLRAPGLGKRHVHYTMGAFVMEAIGELQNRRASLLASAGATDPMPTSSNSLDVDDAAPAKPEPEEDPLGFWQIMKMGLGPDKFPRFADYVMRELTGTPKLATVGDTGIPLTEAVWESLVETNGMDAPERIMGTFTGFFLASPKSKKPSGGATSASSSLRPVEGSRSNTPAGSRSRK